LPLLYVHAALIEQALFNLLDNAVKFSPADSDIRLDCVAEVHNLVITVCDTGPGIDDSEKEKVFERFHTAGQGDRRKSGSGLGLTICRGMIAAHGGKVTIHDNPEMKNEARRGCCVRIELPLENSKETP
jgi:two-component system sensor histidine kinase KdpD